MVMSRSREGAESRSVTSLISIVIPAHNESARIVPTMRSYKDYFGVRAEIIVVANGCTDDTADVVRRFIQNERTSIRLIEVVEPIGKGGALRKGFSQADSPIIGFVDADGATTPQEYDRLLSFVGQYDVVFGSRWITGGTVHNRTSFLRKIASWTFVRLTRALFRMPFHDTQCGAKLFKRDVVRSVLPYLTMSNAAIDVELLVVAQKMGFKLHEEPTEWTDQKSSVFTRNPVSFISTSISMLRSLIKLKRSVRNVGTI